MAPYTSLGLRSWSTSQPTPRPSITPARMFSTSASAVSTSCRNFSRSPSVGQVEHDAALVAVVVGEPGSEIPFGVLACEWRHLAGQFAPRRLHLDDISPEIGQHHRRPRSGQGMGAVDDADALQRTGVRGCHRRDPLMRGEMLGVGGIQLRHVGVSSILTVRCSAVFRQSSGGASRRWRRGPPARRRQ